MNYNISLVTHLPEVVDWANFDQILKIDVPIYIWGKPEYKEKIYRKKNHRIIKYIDWESDKVEKFNFLNQACEIDEYDSKYFYWIDHDIFRQVDPLERGYNGYFEKIKGNAFTLLSTGIGSVEEKHFEKFPIEEFHKYCETRQPSYWCRGSFFGGYKVLVTYFYNIYHKIENQIIKKGFHPTEESILTILRYVYPDIIDAHHLGNDKFEDYLKYLKG